MQMAAIPSDRYECYRAWEWREPAVHVRPGDGGKPLSMYGLGMVGTRCPCTARGWREPAVHIWPGDGGNPLSMYGLGMEGTRCPCTTRGWREPAVHVGSRPNADRSIFLCIPDLHVSVPDET